MLTFLAKRWFLVVLIGGVGLALAFPGLFVVWTRHLKPMFVIGAALGLMAWTMPSRSLWGEIVSPWPALWAVAISYGFVPVAAIGLGELAPLPDFRIGLLLSASVPCTLASAVVWTRLAKGNDATALLVTLVTNVLSWAVTSLWLYFTTGSAIAFNVGQMMLDLALTLLLPVALGQAARAVPTLALFADRRQSLLGILAQFLVLSIILKTAAESGVRLHEGSLRIGGADIAVSIVLAMTLHLSALFFGLYSSRLWGFDRPRRIGVAFSCSQKTLPVALFLFQTYYESAFPLAVMPLLFYHVGQLIVDTWIAEWLKSAPRNDVPSAPDTSEPRP
ncbi:MAG: bile acid:sodium symporter [Gemmataceae bacterium]|nr:bile acid:sodium symporter [Gemmataceae bacterium]MCI0740827.1 bile acid:sodium symporter [Gemmataceae bacterium]